MFWPSDTIKQVILSADNDVHVSFTNNETVHFETLYGVDISQCIADSHNVTITRPHSYTLETGDDDDSHNGIEIVDIQQQQTLGSDLVSLRKTQGQSPFGRHAKRRQAFRKRRSLLTKEDSVEDLSDVMGVDFTSIEPSWSVAGVSPVYDSVAGTRVDATLKLSQLTSSTLSHTLKFNRRTQKRRPTRDMEIELPPPLPPKPFHFTTTLTVEVNTDAPTEDTTSQRLGMYLIDGYQTPADGQRSRLVQPNEALKVNQVEIIQTVYHL